MSHYIQLHLKHLLSMKNILFGGKSKKISLESRTVLATVLFNGTMQNCEAQGKGKGKVEQGFVT